MDLLRNEFSENFISRSRPVNWPPRSCDLTPLYYFLWGYVTAHIQADKPASIDALEDNIEAFIREIPAEMLDRISQNATKRMDHNLQTLNYRNRTSDSNKNFIHFS